MILKLDFIFLLTSVYVGPNNSPTPNLIKLGGVSCPCYGTPLLNVMPTLIFTSFHPQMNTMVTAIILSLLVLMNSPKEVKSSAIGLYEGPYDCFENCQLGYDDCHYSCALPSGCEELCTSPFIECLWDCPVYK